MKVISIRQPWATLIAIGEKRFETRSWTTKHRGPLGIHASKGDVRLTMRSLPSDVQTRIFTVLYEKFGITSGAIDTMPTGVIIATANLKNCLKSVDTGTDGYVLEGGRYIYSPEYESRRADTHGNSRTYARYLSQSWPGDSSAYGSIRYDPGGERPDPSRVGRYP